MEASDVKSLFQMMKEMKEGMVTNDTLNNAISANNATLTKELQTAIDSAVDKAIREHIDPLIQRQRDTEAKFEAILKRMEAYEREINGSTATSSANPAKRRATSVDAAFRNREPTNELPKVIWVTGYPRKLLAPVLLRERDRLLAVLTSRDRDAAQCEPRSMAMALRIAFPDHSTAKRAVEALRMEDDLLTFRDRLDGRNSDLRVKYDKTFDERSSDRLLGVFWQASFEYMKDKGLWNDRTMKLIRHGRPAALYLTVDEDAFEILRIKTDFAPSANEAEVVLNEENLTRVNIPVEEAKKWLDLAHMKVASMRRPV